MFAFKKNSRDWIVAGGDLQEICVAFDCDLVVIKPVVVGDE